MLVGLHFDERHTRVTMYPLYVKNRDPRVNYQPRVLTGKSAGQMLCRLAQMSGAHGEDVEIEQGRAILCLPRSSVGQKK
jgi:hypothetical protein